MGISAPPKNPYTQEGKLLSVHTLLGKDKLLLTSFSGSEGISQLFRFQLEMISTDHAIKGSDLIGKPVTFRLADKNTKSKRTFHGLICRFTRGETEREFTHYQAVVVPWLWQLTQRADCRIFQRQSVPDIIKKILEKLGFIQGFHFRLALARKDYTRWDYCVQYRETDFNFISRLMEQEGISYYFALEGGKDKPIHTVLYLADDPTCHPPCPGQDKARYLPGGNTHETNGKAEDIIASWHTSHSVRPDQYVLRDYHFEKPSATLQALRKSKNAPGTPKWEIYDYPGEYALRFNGPGIDVSKVRQEADNLVARRMEEEETSHKIIEGTSDCRAFTPGFRFQLTDHPHAGEFLLVSVEHSATQGEYRSHTGQGGYHNTFSCLPANVPFRPARITPKPVIHGLQNAVVVGSPGKEIEVDKWGRVKVQFPWDREHQKDLDSSCWIRVAQVLAGKRWGASFWPRIGQEVLVAFMEGDPDQPIIVGSVYNADQPAPYLGDGFDSKHKHDAHVTGIKTNSTPGGKGFNELRFVDTHGKEQVFIHAERNMDTRVKNDSMTRIFGNEHTIVGWEKDGDKGGDRREMVYQDVHRDVKRDQVEHIEGNHLFLVGKGDALEGGNLDVVVEKDKKEVIGKDSHLNVVGNQTEKIDKSYGLEVGKDRLEKVGGNQYLTVGEEQHEKVGKNHALEAGQAIHIKAGQTLILEAGSQVTIKVGGNFIDISSSGVVIKGSQVLINSGGSPGSGSGASPQAPAAPTPALEAQPHKPVLADDSKSGSKSAPD